jgi:hypothetical protein
MPIRTATDASTPARSCWRVCVAFERSARQRGRIHPHRQPRGIPFRRFVPGVYHLTQTQPDGYFQGGQRAGSAGGNATVDDRISSIPVGSDRISWSAYDFWEIPPSDLSGMVYVDKNQNCRFDDGELPLAGVTLHLLNSAGVRVATTTTDAQGQLPLREPGPGHLQRPARAACRLFRWFAASRFAWRRSERRPTGSRRSGSGRRGVDGLRFLRDPAFHIVRHGLRRSQRRTAVSMRANRPWLV